MVNKVERLLAVETVLNACHICQAIQSDLTPVETLAKSDSSPVTVADYAVQALVSLDLCRACPNIPLIAEENTDALMTEAGETLRSRVAHYVQIGTPKITEPQILAAIDSDRQERLPAERYWTLDPIDGTKGFLRDEQYAIALALIEEGEVILGVLGCPNLPVRADLPDGPKGCLFVSVRGEGAFQRALDSPAEVPIAVSDITDPAYASFCESVEAAHSAHNEAARAAEVLGVTAAPVRMDSQCKYATVARGDAEIYLRLPTRADYQEKIWDHAAGFLIINEAGGAVSDMHGRPLDFSASRTLCRNTGVVATNKRLHGPVLAALQQVFSS